jgi:hypothetical protein
MKNTSLLVPLAILVVFGGFFLFSERLSVSDYQFSWQLSEMPEKDGIPQTAVALKINEEVRPLGTYEGSCAEITGSSWTLLEGEVTGVICWWAGGGEEIAVFSEQGRYAVKQGQLDEGTEEAPGTRGNFSTLFEVDR